MSADHAPRFDAEHAVALLREGNHAYVEKSANEGEIGPERRNLTAVKGQYPYAVVVTCSDSRVVPEFIFNAGIGDLFVIRTAGNTVDNCSLGSIEYAVGHLGVRLVVVMGHTHCGAVKAAIAGRHEGHVGYITEEIHRNIGDDGDEHAACLDNIMNSLRVISDDLPDREDVTYLGAVYDIETGRVEFLHQ